MIHIHTSDFPQIAYKKAGQGPPLVLLHGFPDNSGLWDNIVPSLSVLFTVIAIDIPGAGESELGVEETSMETLAKGIKAVIDNEGFNKIVLTGHSMGGYISLAYAEAYPETLKGLSLVHSTAAADNEERKEIRRKAIELVRKGGKEQFLKAAITNMFSEHFKRNDGEIIDKQIKRGVSLPDTSIIAYYSAMAQRPDRKQVLAKARYPIQWILGKEDKLIELSATLPQSRLNNISFVSILDDCGHMSMIEKPASLAESLKEFVSYCYKS